MQRMDRLRRSLRDSFRRKRESPESSKPHQWQADEQDVRNGTCAFPVRYLGCVEVFESRGMQVCEEAMKVLRQSRRRPVKSVLFVSGDGLRVVEDDTKGLIVDQTIEKVSFCAPDRNHERGFSYICRDGTTRRWMCHGFLAKSDSGERISHGVGCSFAFCLERKQKREKECGVSMTFDPKTSTFTRSGSFRVSSITDSNSVKSSSPPPVDAAVRSASAVSTKAIERPHAPPKMLERQGSFRGFTQLANQSPFKRQLSLRLSDLPSNLQRTQNNVDILTNNNVVITNDPLIPTVSAIPTPAPRMQRGRLNSLPNNNTPGVIPETSTVNMTRIAPAVPKPEDKDLYATKVSELCQQVTQGLSLLAANHDELKNGSSSSQFPTKFTNPWDEEVGMSQPPPLTQARPPPPSIFNRSNITSNSSISSMTAEVSNNSSSRIPPKKVADEWTTSMSHNFAQHQQPKPLADKSYGLVTQPSSSISPLTSTITSSTSGSRPAPALPTTVVVSSSSSASSSSTTTTTITTSAPESSGWTGSSNMTTTTTSKISPNITNPSRPPFIHSGSIANPMPVSGRPAGYRGPSRSHSLGADPFDADWANGVVGTGQAPTNPFARQQQTFQVSM